MICSLIIDYRSRGLHDESALLSDPVRVISDIPSVHRKREIDVRKETESGGIATPNEDYFEERDRDDQVMGINPNDEDLEDFEEEFYKIEDPGAKDLRPTPIAGGKPWSSLPSKESALLDDWNVKIGDVVFVRCIGNRDGLAKVSDIKNLDNERYLLVLIWYYTREEIEEELRGSRKIPKRRQAHLDAQWPSNAPFSHMLSSNRTINMWDTLRGKAPPEVMAKLCPNMFYVTTQSIRKICKAEHPNYKWMKQLLYLAPNNTRRL